MSVYRIVVLEGVNRVTVTVTAHNRAEAIDLVAAQYGDAIYTTLRGL